MLIAAEGVRTTHAGVTLLVVGIYTAAFSVGLHLWRVHLVKRGREFWKYDTHLWTVTVLTVSLMSMVMNGLQGGDLID